ncbi:MAG: diguanylate cyclase [Chloroflexi bacterium]|nr:diguanylate cyclase [Chloroflexota bacterium]
MVAAAIYIFLLIALLFQRHWPRRNGYFALFLATGIVWSLSDILLRTIPFADNGVFLAKITLIAFVLMLVPLCHLLETFHDGRPKAPWLVVPYLSVLATATGAALGYLTTGTGPDTAGYSPYNPAHLMVFIGVPFLAIAVRDVYYLVRRLKVAESPAARNRTIYLIAGVATLSIAALSNVPHLGQRFPTVHFGNLVMAEILAYAMLKDRMVDFKLVAGKGLEYLGSTAVLMAVYLVVLYSLQRWFGFELNLPTAAATAGTAIVLAILSYPVRNVLNRRVDRLLYPRTHDYRRMLLEFSNKAGNVIKIEELRGEITKLAAGAVGAKKAYLLTPGALNADYAAPVVVSDGEYGAAALLRLRRDSPVASWLLREGKPLFRKSLDALPGLSEMRAEEAEVVDGADIEVLAPLINRGNLVGILALTRKAPPGAYDMSDLDLIGILGQGIATALENAELHARMEQLAITDMMTEVYNRRYFDARLAEEISRHSRYGGGFSLVFCDLDDFKNYNDTYGHRVGDDILRQVAQAARESLRSVDLVFRYGGDEFALLLPETSAGEALAVCRRLQAGLPTRMPAQGTGLTLSLGVATWPNDGATANEIAWATDEALYHSKRSGGNRISLFSEIHGDRHHDNAMQVGNQAALSSARALVSAVDAKDHYTEQHSRVVAAYATALAREAGLPAEKVAIIETAALLHDIGKIGIPDNLLCKDDRLTPEEWEIIKRHSQLAADIVGPVPSLAPCLPIILHNHEWYNGAGYPAGLKGKSIPLEARILAIADAYASMTSFRPYRSAVTSDQAIEQLKQFSGSQFDPDLVQLFAGVVRLMAEKT